MREAVQPLAKEGVDLLGRQPVAQRLQTLRVGARQDPVVEGLEGDPPLRQLPLHVLVAVEAELGGVGEVGAELQEERPEVPIHGIEVKVINHGRRAHQPGIGLPGHRVPALLGADHRRLFLGPPHEHHALRSGEALQVLRHHVVFPLALRERDERHPLLGHERVDRGYERLADGLHQRRRGEGLPAVPPKEGGHPALVLQPRHVGVEVHPVDAFQFQHHVFQTDPY